MNPTVKLQPWRRLRAQAIASLLAAVALVVTGCSPPANDLGDSLQPAPTSPSGTSTILGTTGTAPELETFADFFGVEFFSDDPGAAEALQEQIRVSREETVRVCMVEEGFDSTPVLPDTQAVSISDETEEERVRRWGFHITTEVGSGMPVVMDSALVYGEPADPNAERLDGMSDAERAVWDETLFGCQHEADRTSPWALYEVVVSSLYAEFGDMDERLNADARTVDLEAAWSRCMAANGYEFADREDLLTDGTTDLRTRFITLMGDDAAFDPLSGWTTEEIRQFFDDKSTEEIETFFLEADQQRLERIDTEALATLQQAEIALAVTDFECRSNLQYNDTRGSIRKEYEADSIDANRDSLEQAITDFRGNE